MTAGERFLVWGAGGHGKVVGDLLRALGHEVVGYVDADPSAVGRTAEPGGARVVLSEAAFLDVVTRVGEYPLGAGACALAVGDNAGRGRCLMALGGLPVPPLVHPLAACSPSARLGRGVVVLPRAVVNADAELGAAVVVNSGAVVEHDCAVSTGAHVSPGAVLAGRVRVGPRSWIGAGAVVIQGLRIGRDAIVGAGAVVIRNVPDGATVVGNPARVLDRVGRTWVGGGDAAREIVTHVAH